MDYNYYQSSAFLLLPRLSLAGVNQLHWAYLMWNTNTRIGHQGSIGWLSNLTFGTQFAHQFVHFRVTNKTIGPTTHHRPVAVLFTRFSNQSWRNCSLLLLFEIFIRIMTKYFESLPGDGNGSHVCEYFTWWILSKRIPFTVHCRFIPSCAVEPSPSSAA